MKLSKEKNIRIDFEVRCSFCDFFELWGMEQAIRALTKVGKLSTATDYDAELFAELILAHADKITCQNCRSLGTLQVKRTKVGDWDWEDAVYCEDCGEEIPPARVVAVPDTKLCVRCRQKYDQDIFDQI